MLLKRAQNKRQGGIIYAKQIPMQKDHCIDAHRVSAGGVIIAGRLTNGICAGEKGRDVTQQKEAYADTGEEIHGDSHIKGEESGEEGCLEKQQ